MKKVFISQPMNKKTEDEIRVDRKKLMIMTKALFDEEIKIIDSFFPNVSGKEKPLQLLGKGIELMADADAVVFAKGWQDYRGCRIEHSCAFEYGKRIIEL